jgi:hypothetical protein
MKASVIARKELNARRDGRYLAIAQEKQTVHVGETIEAFLARGGTIRTITKPAMPGRDINGKFLKKEV